MLALPKQLDAGLDGYLLTPLDQPRELFVGQTLEDGDRADVVDPHQTVAR